MNRDKVRSFGIYVGVSALGIFLMLGWVKRDYGTGQSNAQPVITASDLVKPIPLSPSIGPVGRLCLADYNAWHHTSYSLATANSNRDLKVKIYDDYLAHYATAERLGHEPTDLDRMRIWKNGPVGTVRRNNEIAARQ